MYKQSARKNTFQKLFLTYLLNIFYKINDENHLSTIKVMRILELNPNMTEAELRQMLAENFIRIKSKYSSSTKQIEEIFTRNIKEFVEKLRAKRGTNEKVRKKV